MPRSTASTSATCEEAEGYCRDPASFLGSDQADRPAAGAAGGWQRLGRECGYGDHRARGPLTSRRRRLARGALRLRGWRLAGALPDLPKYLIILAPHTCYWDWPLGMLAAAGFGLKASWLGTDSIFRWPVAGLLRRLGGIPVRRDRRDGVVSQVVAAFAAADSLVVGMTPEGTRFRSPHWRSGFYHMALGAGVPVVPASLDGPTRQIAVGPPLHLSGDLRRDMEVIRLFYADARGIHRERVGPVRLPEEGPAG